jgi:hypothetical protein
MLNSINNDKCFRLSKIIKAKPLCCKATVKKTIIKKGIVMSSGQIQIKGENMEKKRFVVLELTEDEEKELNDRRDEFFREKSALGRIPICINEIDLDEWAKAFAIASPYDEEIFSLFHFYEDGKDRMRCD